MKITKRGAVLELEGKQPKVGERAPDFSLMDINNQNFHLSDLYGKAVLISVIPDIDTSVCAIQTKRFNQEAGKLKNVHFLTVSNNTREQQENWCAAEGVDMQMLHDPDLKFGKAYGLYIPEIGHLARSIFVLDQTGKIVYEEIVSELTNEPDYQKALDIATQL